MSLCPLLLSQDRILRNGDFLVSEDFVDDGDDVGDVDAPVVVEVALLGSEGDYHLGVGWDGAGEGVVHDVDG